MLQIQNLIKKYGKVIAVDQVDLEVKPGEVAVLLGPNGAGKSTLIKCASGLLRFSGEVKIGGYPGKSLEAKRLLGYIPELPAVYDLLTVREHLEFISKAYRLSHNEEEANRLLERFELMDKADKLGRELSKGMQQKLSICCALLHRPKVVVFDEPMVGLDPHAIKELKSIFTELRNEGASVLISTHMLDSIESCWDSVHIMVKGKIVYSRRESEESEKSLEEIFFAVTEGERGQL